MSTRRYPPEAADDGCVSDDAGAGLEEPIEMLLIGTGCMGTGDAAAASVVFDDLGRMRSGT